MIETRILDRPRYDSPTDLLLATKLQIPPLPHSYVHRPRLTQRLDEGLQGKLTLICAPAGFGKTSLLSEWCVAPPESTLTISWVSLDRSDNDPVRFWTDVIVALEQSHPGSGKEALALLHSPRPAPMELVLITLINAISAVGHSMVLVLDDYHVIDEAAIHQALAFLLEYLPPQLHLLLASRSDPSLPLARLRGQGQLHEVSLNALRFTLEEAETFLQKVTGIPFTEEQVALLDQRTEGWITGLYLAALSLKRRSDSTDLSNIFAGNHRYIVDYFNEEVLHQQPEAIRTFLLQTSILEQLSGSLCDAVTGQRSGQAILEQIEQSNLFLVPLDDERIRYRYHPLLTDVLRRQLQQSQPDLVPELHRRAAAWYEQESHTVEAVSHALASGDHEWTARLIEQAVDSMLRSGEHRTLRQWLQALPEACLQHHPRLSTAQVALLNSNSQLKVVESHLNTGEHGLPQNFSLPLIEPLSGRELEVLHLVATGQSNREIAHTLIVSAGTVKTHLKHIFGKLDVHTRTQAVACARELHLLPL
jgi:LuxR family transcriptional regulator, maltose regulon positive regulatory protein